MLVGVSPILTLKVRIEQIDSARRQRMSVIERRNLDVENIKEGRVKSWVTWITTLRVSEVDDFANPVHRRIVHLRILNGSSLTRTVSP